MQTEIILRQTTEVVRIKGFERIMTAILSKGIQLYLWLWNGIGIRLDIVSVLTLVLTRLLRIHKHQCLHWKVMNAFR
jgi:hypothetical protein